MNEVETDDVSGEAPSPDEESEASVGDVRSGRRQVELRGLNRRGKGDIDAQSVVGGRRLVLKQLNWSVGADAATRGERDAVLGVAVEHQVTLE